MERICPKHVEGFIETIDNGDKYKIDDFNEFDKYTFPYEIKCSCTNKIFKIYIDEHPSVVAECSRCGKKIIVYDLKYYPAATKIKKEFPLKEYVSRNGDELFNICVVYEYSDEFEYEDDVEFDKNDISWCTVYGYGIKSKKVFEIISDETT
ncbi:hypothetical protein [Clostridium saccharobutylicum]|uniref:Uncharacterized protein n=1 Tax=Clostridium saccharobutylicum TaxID=169679 RepID=A0A1S8MQ86_CLOSA|nr:hypothetical protein [Clostridium saccharobutylicum]OOM06330.1 hypothetical protein CLOSAC_42490 [Clostridium saccharobutylicum]